jgi:hemoglobin
MDSQYIFNTQGIFMTSEIAIPLHPATTYDSAESAIRHVVVLFYDKVRADELLGPVFARFIEADWNAHLDRMCDFWSTVLFHTTRYKGQPMQAHLQIAEISPQHFERWLALFTETVNEHCDETLGKMFIERATRMRENLQAAIMRFRRAA